MYIQAYNKENGLPSLFESGVEIPDNYIREIPPSSLYDPIYYSEDLGRWVGADPPTTTKPPEVIIPEEKNETEETLAQIVLENTLIQFSMKKTSERVKVLESIVNEIKLKEDTPKEEDNGDTMPEV
ncbi:tail fiber protein [Staphylococcus phage PG-2021_67]